MGQKAFPLATLIIVAWTVVIGASLAWNVAREHDKMFELARLEARTNFNKDVSFRRWATFHGGVYVPVGAKQQPIGWLANVPGRDVTATDGRKLTLVNPASMMRQMMDQYAETYGIRGRITALRTMNPANAPDDWERQQLLAFDNGQAREAWVAGEVDGKPHLRYLQALYMEQGCIKCHAAMGYTRVGQLRGAISVSVPLEPYHALFDRAALEFSLTHGGIWLIGMAGIGVVGRNLRQRRIERERMERDVRENEERLKLAVEGADLGLWDWNVQSGDVVFSARWTSMLGYSSGEIEPRLSSWAGLVHPDDLARVMPVLTDHLEGRSDSYEAEFRMRMRSGEWKWIYARGRVFERDRAGRPLRAAGTHLDISERKRAEEMNRNFAAELERKVEERTAELKRAYTELEAFSYSVSHDLRAPLRAINGYAAILEEETAALSAENRIYLERIKAGAVRMGELIDDMLDFTRLGRDEFLFSRVDLKGLVGEVVAELAGNHPRTQVIVGELGEADCDPAMIKQVWTNLVANALKFSSRHEQPRVEVGVRDGAGGRAYFVRDNGVGFDMGYAAKLFGVFQRLHREQDFGGTGIGLAIVKRIIERHGGHVWAESAPGQGATFWFTLRA